MALSDAQLKLIDVYNEGLALYKQRKFKEAKAKFEECDTIVPGDGPAALYVGRCIEYIKNPPDEDWDGVYTMTTK